MRLGALHTGRRLAAERVGVGTPVSGIDRSLGDACRSLDAEEQSVLWLYAWHCTMTSEAGPRPVARNAIHTERA